jgi:hypothetical protein
LCLCSRLVPVLSACACALGLCLCSRLVPVLSACALSAYAFVPGSVVMACFHSLVFGLDPVFVRSSGFGLARFNLFRFFGPLFVPRPLWDVCASLQAFVPRFGTFVPCFRPLCLSSASLWVFFGLSSGLLVFFGLRSLLVSWFLPHASCTSLRQCGPVFVLYKHNVFILFFHQSYSEDIIWYLSCMIAKCLFPSSWDYNR